MPHRLRQKTRKAKGHFKDKVILMTYHSAKGLQKPVCILMETDKMHYLKKEDILQKKLLYVGMTRASKKLFIHAEDFEKESYAKHLWNIAKNTD
jgi:superfamily I DNA/RNA helicase